MGLVLLVCFGMCSVFVGPYLLGYFLPGWGLGFIALEALYAWYALRSSAQSTTPSWAQRNPVVFTLSLLFFGGLVICGLVNGVDERARSAREAIEREQADRALVELHETQRRAEREARERQEREAQQRVEAERAAEARRTPAERAAIASAILMGAGDLHDRVCRARTALAPIQREARSLAEVRAALRTLKTAERADLRELRESFRHGRHILCSDGWTSSCECNRRSRSGCCSWHGGISGCEPLPTEITCSDMP